MDLSVIAREHLPVHRAGPQRGYAGLQCHVTRSYGVGVVAYIQSISQKPGKSFGTTTSLEPQSPSIEQVPAESMHNATPWQFTEPMPKNGERSGTPPS